MLINRTDFINNIQTYKKNSLPKKEAKTLNCEPSFKGLKDGYWEYTKYARYPSVKAYNFISDKNVDELLKSKSISIKDIYVVINNICDILEDYSLNDILRAIKEPKVKTFISKYKLQLAQAPLVNELSNEQLEAFGGALKELNNPDLEKTSITRLQNSDGFMLSAETKEQYDKDFDSYTHFKFNITPDGKYQISRIETDVIDETTARLRKDGTETIIRTAEDDFGKYINQLTEIHPDCIISSKLSDKLEGVYSIDKFEFKDYPEEFDLLANVRNGSLQSTHPLSKVTDNDNSVEYREKFENNGITSERIYKEAKDKSFRQYRIVISENGNNLLDIDRSWRKLTQNVSITTVNGKQFITDFTNIPKIEIKDGSGNKTTVNLRDKAPNMDLEFIKSLDALTLLNMNKYAKQVVPAKRNIDSAYGRLSEVITTTPDIFSFNHEIGHAIQCDKFYSNPQYPQETEKLMQTYNEEFSRFNDSSNSEIRNILKYFSQISDSIGFDELIAETHAILNTCTTNDLELAMRSHMLMRYFPKTIAEAAKLLGYGK